MEKIYIHMWHNWALSSLCLGCPSRAARPAVCAALSRVLPEERLGNHGDAWPRGDAVRPEAHLPNTFFRGTQQTMTQEYPANLILFKNLPLKIFFQLLIAIRDA